MIGRAVLPTRLLQKGISMKARTALSVSEPLLLFDYALGLRRGTHVMEKETAQPV